MFDIIRLIYERFISHSSHGNKNDCIPRTLYTIIKIPVDQLTRIIVNFIVASVVSDIQVLNEGCAYSV